jgi:hypothetical protein
MPSVKTENVRWEARRGLAEVGALIEVGTIRAIGLCCLGEA